MSDEKTNETKILDALRIYGSHKQGCEDAMNKACSCGFTAALAAKDVQQADSANAATLTPRELTHQETSAEELRAAIEVKDAALLKFIGWVEAPHDGQAHDLIDVKRTCYAALAAAPSPLPKKKRTE